jgi:fatty-acyl-CoA synthase
MVPRLLRRLGRALYVVYGGAVIGVGLGTLWLVTLVVRRSRWAVALQRVASAFMLAALGCRFVVRGALPTRDGRGRVLVSNHTSYLDIPLMLAALGHDFAFVTKSELLEWPVISLITRAGGHIPVDRARVESRGAVVARMAKTLRGGRDVFVFPEGTFSLDEGLRPFQLGAFRAAVDAGAPVVPIATRGVGAMWSQHVAFPGPGRAEVVVGEGLAADPALDADGQTEALRAGAERFISEQSGLSTAASRRSP